MKNVCRFAQLLPLICLLSGGLAAAPLSIRVASEQSETRQRAAIDDALAEVEKLSSGAWPAEGVVVELPAKVIRLDKPLKIGQRLSGRAGAPLVIRGAGADKTALSGATSLDQWARVPVDDPAPLPSTARELVRRHPMPWPGDQPIPSMVRQGQGLASVPAPPEILHAGQPMALARWPNDGFSRLAGGRPADATVQIEMTREHAAVLSHEAELWLHGYWGQDWADEWIAAGAVDPARQTFELVGGPPLYGSKAGQRVRIVNALSELDMPGEWYIDRARRQVYFWPPGPGVTEMTNLENVLRLEGVSHVRIERMRVEGSRGDAVVVAGGRDARLQQLHVRNAGQLGVRISGQEHAVVDSDIEDTGQGGILLWGGDRQTLSPAGLVAQGNRIRRFNRWVRTYRPAVMVSGVGNVVRGNLIEGGPHTGLLFFGNDHLIELNSLSKLATETGDVGAIYTGMDWTARGTVIRHNMLHDIRGPGLHGSRGIYLDDQASGIVVLGNVFLRVDQAVFIGGGRDNLVDGNLFVASSPAIHLDDRGLTWQKAKTEDPDGPLRRSLKDVPYRTAPYARYPGLAELLDKEPGRPLGNVARRNAVVGGQTLHFQGSAERDLVVDRMFGAELLRFTSAQAAERLDIGQLQLADDSAALREGFPLLPWARMRCANTRWSGIAAGGQPRDDSADCRSNR